MTNPANTTEHAIPAQLADEAVALVRRWLTEASHAPVDASGEQLAGVLKDPSGLDFTVGFVDGVVRPEDLSVAAANLSTIAAKAPAFLPWYMRRAIELGGLTSRVAPGVVIPIARKVLRKMVGHLIVDATDSKLGGSIAKLRREGVRLNINLLGEAILGKGEADRRLAGTKKLLERDDVDYVSIKVSSTVAPHNHWAFDEAVEHIADELAPLFRIAKQSPKYKFINLDMEEYKDLDLTIAVFTKLLSAPEFKDLEAGIVLQAYLPDALSAMMHLQEWSADRVANGGAPIKVRLVKGANLPMEVMEADIHGWPLATWHSKQASDTSYKSVLNYALHPERVKNVRLGVAGHNLFDIALAWLLAKERGAADGIEFEMLLGMATAQAEAVRKDVGSLLLYTPVVHPNEFDVAIAYLIRRLEEGASTENFMSAVFELEKNEALFEREKQRFLASLADLDGSVPPPNRDQNRSAFEAEQELQAVLAQVESGRKGDHAGLGPVANFQNTPDTDPDLPANRAWGREILERVPASTLGIELADSSVIKNENELGEIMTTATTAAKSWGALSGTERAAVLHRAGVRLEARRATLLEVMASECGKTLDQSDPEVSEAIDFAHYYAELAVELDSVDGARFVPSTLTVVTPPWNFPVAIPAGSVLSALAAGSAVVIKPAKQARRCGAEMVEAIWEAFDEAGISRDVLQYVQVADRTLGTALVAHPAVDRLILTGGYETAELFRSFRKDLPLLAETSGKNAIIVTPSADLDLAARDVAQSAFGHAGQKCSAASLVILVGSVAKSRRFKNQLLDAVRSLQVGYPVDPGTQMGPVIEPAEGKLLRGLTTLGDGEAWAIRPKQLDDSGKLWSPGVRYGVKRGSEFHKTEYFGPILGVMTAKTLDEAIAMVNEIDFGLTSGLHSLNPSELAPWLAKIDAGNLYVNRGITGAIVRRQPFGGWKKSAVGAGTKAGGPNYLVGLGAWENAPLEKRSTEERPLSGANAALVSFAKDASVSEENLHWLQTALLDDASWWDREFGVAKDVSGLRAERNVFRYRPLPVTVRLGAGAADERALVEVLRVLGAGILARHDAHSATPTAAPVTFSSATPVPNNLRHVLEERGISVHHEEDADWKRRLSQLAAQDGPHAGHRVRLIHESLQEAAAAVDGKPDIAFYGNPVVASGRIELLTFLREQAISVTAHRFGTPNHLSDELL
ncbi:proline dehydrogenase family protein [Humidisolicoccus flavus]|uniref:proline dehydrogenase family protein n=1 Tax=Humidisolicoccus flavus TaxID=3111414 RepID=UPI003245136F